MTFWDKEPPKILLSSFSVWPLPQGVQPALKSSLFPGETSLEETQFSLRWLSTGDSSQLALGSPCLHLPGLKLQVNSHAYPANAWVSGEPNPSSHLSSESSPCLHVFNPASSSFLELQLRDVRGFTDTQARGLAYSCCSGLVLADDVFGLVWVWGWLLLLLFGFGC